MHRMRLVALALVGFAVLHAAPAWADGTLFVGANTTPSNRAVKGFGLGVGILIAAFEFEYGATSDDETAKAPSLKTYSGNGLLQTPVAIFGFQPYVTAGIGVYRERLGKIGQTGFAPNTGGGVKISLAGPIRLRVDYRVFKLGDGAQYSPSHRLYAGLNVKF